MTMEIENSPLLETIGQAQQFVVHRNHAAAQVIYDTLWAEAQDAQDAYRSCIVAHFMAHAQTEPAMQRVWHFRALQSADAVGDERVNAFYPSLYANLAEVLLRLGDHAQARVYAAQARSVEAILGSDGYGYMIHSLITRVSDALESEYYKEQARHMPHLLNDSER